MPELFSLTGQVVIVTGASKEMGEANALTLAEYGADGAVTARDARALEALAERIRGLGRRSLAITADLTRGDERQGIVDRTVAELGGVDILVNTAGGGPHSNYGWALRLSEQQWEEMLALNLTAP